MFSTSQWLSEIPWACMYECHFEGHWCRAEKLFGRLWKESRNHMEGVLIGMEAEEIEREIWNIK
jgi:hypothetical protein